MANPETIINSLRGRCTNVFEACQENLSAIQEDRDDFIAELGASYFTDWFDTTVGYDITFAQLVDAIVAADDLLTAFELARSKLQIVRTR